MLRKKFRGIALMLCVSMLLGGCGKGKEEPPSEAVSEQMQEQKTEQKTEQSEEPITEATAGEPDLDLYENLDPKVAEIISSMTLEEKVSQMIIPAVRRWDADNEVNEEDLVDGVLVEEKRGEPITELNDETRSIFTDFSFGGVILFADNFVDTEQTVRLIRDINEANQSGDNKTELFICADEEGGNVARLTSGTAFCGNMALAATMDRTNVEETAQLIGKELSAVGINVNFAPDADVNNNPGNPVIGVRSFSDIPEIVDNYDRGYIIGMHSENIMTAAKHFPGHGNTETDSHTGLPLVNTTEDELAKVELFPFTGCIYEGTDFIMSAHIQYPMIEKETYKSKEDGSEIYLPGTLSKKIITGILRDELGYEGITVTDSMVMDAIYKNFEPMDSAKYAINAGEDMILMPIYLNTPDSIKTMHEYIDGIVKMVEDGEIEESRIDEAVIRILETKLKYGLLDGKIEGGSVDDAVANALEVVGSKENHEREWEITEKAITMVKNDGQLLPLDASKKTLLLCPADNHELSLEYGVQKLKEDGYIPEDSNIDIKCYKDLTAEDAKTIANGYENVVAVTQLFNAAGLDPEAEGGEKAAFLDSLIETVHSNGGKFVLISARLPYDVARYQDADAILLAFGDRGMDELPSEEGSISIYGPNIPVAIYTAFGGNTPSGKLPVNIPKINDDYSYSDELLYERGFGLEQ